MDSFLVGKIGEVFAFARASRDILQKGREGFLKIMKEEELEDCLSANETYIEVLLKVAEENDIDEKVREKAAKTEEKLNKMRDIYLPREGDLANPAELAEWMGFFEGAAYVHWSLVESEARERDMKELSKVGREAANFHEAMLEKMAAFVKTV